jgi:hypothetical protein
MVAETIIEAADTPVDPEAVLMGGIPATETLG